MVDEITAIQKELKAKLEDEIAKNQKMQELLLQGRDRIIMLEEEIQKSKRAEENTNMENTKTIQLLQAQVKSKEDELALVSSDL